MEDQSNSRHSGVTRADRWIRERFPALTARHVEEAIERGLVVGPRGEKLRKGQKLAAGETPDVSRLQAWLGDLKRGNPALEVPILVSREDLWVVDKPAGVHGHPISLFDNRTVTHWALARDPRLADEFPEAQPTITPHRLDTGTSGCLLVARTRRAYDLWRARFAAHAVKKRYLAWCWGVPARDELVISHAIGKAPGDRTRRAIDTGLRPLEGARPAVSRVRVELRLADAFLAAVECETGVTHQVRVHLASAGYPLVGDVLYDVRFDSRRLRPETHYLRAVRLEGEGEIFEAPEEGFRRLLS